MGFLHALSVPNLMIEFNLSTFVETGTFRGDGLLHAMAFPFSWLHSIEANPELWKSAGDRVEAERPDYDHYTMWRGDTAEVLAGLLPRLERPALFWLDAHLPELYGMTDATRLPLLQEVQAIVAEGRHGRDVLIMDDWRLYEPGSCTVDFYEPPRLEDAQEIRRLLAPTHRLLLDTRDEGYMVARPRVCC